MFRKNLSSDKERSLTMNKVIVLLLVAIVAVGIALSSKDMAPEDNSQKIETANMVTKPATPPAEVSEVEMPADETSTDKAEATDAKDEAEDAAPATLPESITPVIYGAQDAPVVMKEYASFSCSHCATFHNDRLPALTSKYIDEGKLRLEVHSFVRNQQDLRATMLIQCQDDAAKRKQFMKVLFKSQADWAYSADFINNLKKIANIGGVNAETFDACINDKTLEEAIIESRGYFQNVVKVSSTPFFVIGDEIIQGVKGMSTYEKIIDAALESTNEEKL
jgi:protein-disulfide isomerase